MTSGSATAANASEMTRSSVLSETQNPIPRITPAAKMRANVTGPPVRTTSATTQTVFQRLSVRYSIDLRKNGGKMLRSTVEAIATRRVQKRRAITYVAHRTTPYKG